MVIRFRRSELPSKSAAISKSMFGGFRRKAENVDSSISSHIGEINKVSSAKPPRKREQTKKDPQIVNEPLQTNDKANMLSNFRARKERERWCKTYFFRKLPSHLLKHQTLDLRTRDIQAT